MIIVAGHLVVEPTDRTSYLETCRTPIEEARRAPGCLDFSVTADLVDDSRVNVFERWESREQLDAFRTGGSSEEQQAMVRGGSVAEYEVAGVESVLG